MQRSTFVNLAFLSGPILALAIATVGLAQGGSPEPGFIEIHGRNVDGATVYLNSKSLGKLKNGQLVVPNVYPGHYTLRVELKPYYPEAIAVTVPPGKGIAVTVGVGEISVQEQAQQSATSNLTLAPTSASVRLSCLPMECQLTIAPVASAGGTPQLPHTTFQEHFGEDAILVTGLPQGSYKFTVTSAGPQGKTYEATQGLCNGDRLDLTADFHAKLGGLSFGLTHYPNCKALTVKTSKP